MDDASTEEPAVDSEPDRSKESAANLEFIMDIPLEVTVRLGRAKLPISDLLDLAGGSVIELDRAAGEPLDVLVNNKLVARGEAVVINDKFGVRLTEIVAPTERIPDLK
jgi:flagellar motor switch protein FliN/FliY